MLEFVNGVLDCKKLEHIQSSTVYEKDDMKIDYDDYIRNDLVNDINFVVDKMNDVFNSGSTVGLAKPFNLRHIRCVNRPGQLNITSDAIDVMVTIQCLAAPIANNNNLPEFKLMSLPVMSDCGVLERKKKKYAIIRELVQDNDITIVEDAGRYALKIITDTGNFVNIFNSPVKPLTKFGQEKIKIVNAIYGLATLEELDLQKIRKILVSPALYNMYLDKEQAEDVAIAFGLGRTQNYLNAILSEDYAIRTVRDKINEVLSIDRAKGKILSRDIQLPNGRVIEKGKRVTEDMLRMLKFHKINEVYVKAIPIYNGWFVAKPILLDFLIKGTKLTPSLLKDPLLADSPEYLGESLRFGLEGDELPEIKGLRNVYSDHVPIIYPGTEVTPELLDLLSYNGYSEVVLKEKEDEKNPAKFKTIPLEVSIVGNRHFRASEINVESEDEWVYVNEDGSISPAKTNLCAYDYIAMLSLYDRIYLGEDVSLLASNDLGLRKKLNQTGAIFSKAFRKVTPKFIRKISRTIRDAYADVPTYMSSADDIQYMFRGFENDWWSYMYKDMKVISLLDRTNPLSFYSSLHTVKAIFADKDAIPEGAHLMTMGHHSKLCPFETPSGKALGTTLHKAIRCKIEKGVMKAPYHPVITNNSTGVTKILLNKIDYLTVKDEEKYRIADISALDFDEKTGIVFTTERILARVPAVDAIEKVTVSYIRPSNIQYVSVDPNQIDSLVASSIPFQGANDAARVVFETSMAKQAKALLNGDIPIVATSAFVDTPRLSTYFMIHAEYDGIVEQATNGSVVMTYDNGIQKEYVYDPTEYSGESLIVRALEVTEGQYVKAGDILVSSNFTKEGIMVTGINALVAFVPKGCNYEDGVFASERLSQKAISYRTHTHVEPLSRSTVISDSRKLLKNKYAAKGRTIVKYRKTTNGKKSRYVEVKADEGVKGFVCDMNYKYSDQGRIDGLKFDMVSLNPLTKGDKTANRHGNKGVAPIVRSNDQMLQFNNGEFVDSIYNPAGVASRMNLGQVLECNLGLACYVLGIRARSDSYNGASRKEIKMLLQYTWDLANLDNCEEVFRNPAYASIPEALHEHCRKNIHKIRMWKDSFNPDGTAWLFNPKTGRMLEQPAVVGINYIYKLIHESDKKIQARGGLCSEPYLEKTAAPTHGISNHGGQRNGYMEFDAYCAYGAAELLHEIENECGDNPIARNNLTVDALHNGDGYKLNPTYAIRRSTEEFVAKARALGMVIDFEGELPNDTKEYTAHRNVYRIEALIKATGDDDTVTDEKLTAKDILDDID